jgi:tetrahydromethanopterin S-methyltransferase subunit D
VAQKARSLRRTIGDLLLSVASLAVVIVLLVAFDPQVREEASSITDGRGSPQVAAATGEARKLTHVVTAAVKEQSKENRPLMIMFVAGAALALFMFRT